MEESAQRRERLKAMRMEASQEGPTSSEGSEHSAVSLSNPLLEPTVNPVGQMQPLGQSFNYYTNPMAAYSGNKQKSQVSPQISQDYSSIPPRPQTNDTFPSPSFQPQMNHPPNPRMQPPQGHYQNPNYSYTPNPPQGHPSPVGYRGPGGVNFPSPGPQWGPGPGPGQGGYPSPGRGYPSPGRGYPNPRFTTGQYPSPGPHHGSGPGLGYPTSGPNQGRGHWSGSGPSYGRGRGRWSGQGGGRGGHNHVTAEDRPDLFYNKSMVEDPWEFLEPVIWKSHNKPKPWLLYSSNTKKPRVSEPRPSSQQSLAEILAASFNEAASGEPDSGL